MHATAAIVFGAIYLRAFIYDARGQSHDDANVPVSARPIIMPFMFFGPSNQIHQAKEAIYAMQVDDNQPAAGELDAGSFTLMLPDLLPHYSQSEVDGAVAFSEYFDIESRFIIQEGDIFGNLVKANEKTTVLHDGSRMRRARHIGNQAKWPENRRATVRFTDECVAYHRSGLTGRLLERCGEQVERFRARHAGKPCKNFTLSPFHGSMRALAADMRATGRTFALSCFLERPMSTQLVIDHVLHSKPEDLISNDVRRWFDTPNKLRLRLGKAPELPTLTLHLRAPDDVVQRKKRTPSENFVIGKDPKKNAIVPGKKLTGLIQGIIAEADGRRGVAIQAIHVMTNDPFLADFLYETFQWRGYSVTFSADRSITALMNDYNVATQSIAFCGMRKSSITTNIEQARLALFGLDGVSGDQFWEDIIPGAK